MHEDAVEVPLVRRDGSVRGVALIDANDALEVLSHRWSMDGRGYAGRTYRDEDGRWRWTSLHRALLGLRHGDPRQGDHIDRDPLNCRRSNLRIATHAQNGQNRASNRGSTSRFRGVTWSKNERKWKVAVKVDGRQHHLGYFADEQGGEPLPLPSARSTCRSAKKPAPRSF